VAAVLLNLWLMKHYELPHMPLWMVAPGLLLLCTIGQLAVLVPAQRAARVPPVVATRSA
jgi:putative ABC transport system permease protein